MPRSRWFIPYAALALNVIFLRILMMKSGIPESRCTCGHPLSAWIAAPGEPYGVEELIRKNAGFPRPPAAVSAQIMAQMPSDAANSEALPQPGGHQAAGRRLLLPEKGDKSLMVLIAAVLSSTARALRALL